MNVSDELTLVPLLFGPLLSERCGLTDVDLRWWSLTKVKQTCVRVLLCSGRRACWPICDFCQGGECWSDDGVNRCVL
jgi:hypothetical protein